MGESEHVSLKIVLISHYFVPEIGAPSARLYEMAREWVRSGHTVSVVTCFPNHPTGIIDEKYKGMHFLEEEIDGIRVLRNFVYATPNKGFFRKTLSHVSFMISSVVLSLRKTKRADVVIVSSPTFFSVISAWFFSRINKIPFIFEVRDLWPAIFVDLNVITNKWVIKFLELIEMYLYQSSVHIVVVTQSFKKNLVSRGIRPEKLSVITNGADVNFFSTCQDHKCVKEKYQLNGKFVVLYIGAHGISQGLSTIIEAADKVRDIKDIHFLFVGEGADKESLINNAQSRNLQNVTFIDGVSKDQIPYFYHGSDVCLVPLRNVPLFKEFIPSKMFEIMASSKPIIASVNGESADILQSSGAAFVTPPEDVLAVSQAILCLSKDAKLCKKMGENGRKFVEEHYCRSRLAQEYIDVMDSVT